ncbi:phospholipase A1-Igamma1, chloroplastic [Sorghum bicolor]|uniref:phospholipase A1-Igamma1, chloroplastic n=1 Tax=Sorghum bicolor TaxID=4558 RepID=UPI000B425171|nr:phospholipase A1-Igamma1, chloroplastic [Sorghum bicolor]|eukprot:XP_002443555.2 phospholipase A1-Igamma1, chloroplastic [Sorghum bicolor]
MDADEGQVLNYCKLAQAAYDAYDSHNGTSRYPLTDLLPALGLGGNGYVATSFLYATVNILTGDGGGVNEENDCPHKQHWIGYVAVATDAERDRVGYRDIAVVWRGTSTLDELLKDLQAVLVPIHGGGQGQQARRPEVQVERGFESLYTSSCDACNMRTSARSQVLAELSRLVTYLRNRYPGEGIRVTATGHCLGGALALLTAAWDAADPAAALPGGVVVRAVTFAAPRVGNQAFCDELVAGKRRVSVQRVIVDRDVVPTLPPTFFGYADAGNNVRLLNAGHVPLPFLTLLVPWHFHGIKQYLRLLDPTPVLLPPAVPAPVPVAKGSLPTAFFGQVAKLE